MFTYIYIYIYTYVIHIVWFDTDYGVRPPTPRSAAAPESVDALTL